MGIEARLTRRLVKDSERLPFKEDKTFQERLLGAYGKKFIIDTALNPESEVHAAARELLDKFGFAEGIKEEDLNRKIEELKNCDDAAVLGAICYEIQRMEEKSKTSH